MKLISNKIVEFRYRAGLTQIDIAEAMGVSKTAVSNWEQGVNQPSPQTQNKLLEYFSQNEQLKKEGVQVRREDMFEYEQ